MSSYNPPPLSTDMRVRIIRAINALRDYRIALLQLQTADCSHPCLIKPDQYLPDTDNDDELRAAYWGFMDGGSHLSMLDIFEQGIKDINGETLTRLIDSMSGNVWNDSCRSLHAAYALLHKEAERRREELEEDDSEFSDGSPM